MVRSKFPGKPSKIVNRKVVKSSKYCALHDNESSKAAENISYGLAVFNEAFGDHEQVLTAFHGFSPHEVDRARDSANKQQEKVEDEYKTNGLNFPPDDAFPVKIDPPTSQVLSYVAANLSLIGPVGGHSTRAQCQNLHFESKGLDLSKSISPSKFFSPVNTSFKKHVANRLLQRAKKANLEVSSPTRLLTNSKLDAYSSLSVSGVNRTFVLPSRSARSSRVIKPNKRFLDADGAGEDPPSPPNAAGQPSHTRVIELKKPRLIFDGEVDFSVPRSDGSKINPSEGKFKCEMPLSMGTDSMNTEHVKLADLNVFGAPTTRPKRRVSLSSAEGSPKKDGLVAPCTSSPPAKLNHHSDVVSPSRSKLILRESKLNISSATDKVKEDLFSSKPKKGLSVKVIKSPGASVDCGVCSAVLFHRLTKQSLKFGSICCDPCRKFITKMTVRAKSSENSVPCENGQGNCAVSSPLKAESFATKVNRCGACWLLLCVQRLVKMPENIRDSLIRMLPANMQGMTVLLPPVTVVSNVTGNRNRRRKGQTMQHAAEDHSAFSPKSNSGQSTPSSARKLSTSSTSKRLAQTPIARIKRKAALVSLANNLKRARDKTFSPTTPPGPVKKSSCSGESLEKSSKIKTLLPSKKSDARLKTAEKSSKRGINKNLEKNKDGQTRQKLSLKGPRVKHVCRSASIVLGQPLATFPMKSPVTSSGNEVANELKVSTSGSVSNTIEDVPIFKHDNSPKESKSKGDCKVSLVAEVENTKEPGLKSASHMVLPPSIVTESNTKLVSKPDPRINQNPAPGRKITRLPNVPNQNKLLQRGQRRTLQDLGIYGNHAVPLPELISLDFWESYDPDEVCNSGFGLIGFDPFHMKPVCFLCGSAGKKKLIHCASCCEPYHQFCIEMGVLGGPGPVLSEDQSKDEIWLVDWVCPRCTVCHGCGYNTGHQLTVCQRCHHSYHQECLGTTALRKSASDRLWICASCLRCKSCNSADVTKFVGNLPFCKVCFKLRQKGNFCPLCQGCYTDDDYQSKMMECADCKSWVHAKCEGLSDEKYQVLSYLPESVEFICRLCCVAPPAPWWVAVEAELQAGYNNIIKAITKNRKAYAMLKWSPQKTCVCLPRVVALASKISSPGKRRLSFNFQNQADTGNTSVASQKTSRICKTVSFKDEKVASVFEFDEDIDAGENTPITKYIHAKEKIKGDGFDQEYSKLHLDCGSEAVEKNDKTAQFSPNTGSQSDSGVGSTDDELKACSATEEEEVDEFKTVARVGEECTCQNLKPVFPTLLTIKKRVHSNEYSSILEFHRDMDLLISEADSHEVKELYHQTLQEVFPWFDPKYDKVTRNSFPLSPCKPYHGSRLQYQSNSASPEKFCSNYDSSLKILKRLLPKDTSKLEDGYFYCGMNSVDTRICGFCKLAGDSDAYAEGRLLYCGQNDWVHVNCALWSAEVFEEIDGALQNVSNALSRGRMIRCSQCGRKGASVGCCAKKCEETLHFPCARVAGFVFMEDKNAFCSLHSKDAPGKPLIKASDFDVCRPVFVELDRRKKKSVESKHVRLMIGSLLVQNLGTIVPDMSDLGSSIVPTQFCCTRLFWSSKEPWRIVRYTIQTTIRLPAPEPVVDLGHHITVDHSKEMSSTNFSVNISVSKSGESFQNCSEKVDLTNVGSKVEESAAGRKTGETHLEPDDNKIVRAVVSHLLDTVCSREVDEEVTDVQNSADLLPPELKDAIFEDLPQGLLDGISMQDIFQDKYLNFDELGKEESQEESSANGPAKCESEKQKMRNLKTPRELKRSKSDVLPSNSSHLDSRLHQRSCSLAWSYKLGANITCCKAQKMSTTEVVMDRTKLIQELRLSVKPAPSDLRYCLPGPGDKGKENQSLSWSRIMQVDGVYDAVLSGSDEGSDVEAIDSKSIQMQQKMHNSNFVKDSELLCNRIECLKSVTSAALFQNSVARTCSEFVNQDVRKCKRRRSIKKMCFERKGDSDSSRKLQIPQLDGTNDVSSDSEVEQCAEKPVRCVRCGCTYRTEESHARHLPSCSGDYSLTTSESETEISEDEAAGTAKSVSAPSPDSAISSISSGSLSVAAYASPVTLPTASPTVLPVLSPSTQTIVPTSTPAIMSVMFNPARSHNESQAMPTHVPPSVQSFQQLSNPIQGAIMAPVSKVQRISSNKSKATRSSSSQQQTVKFIVKDNQSVLQHVFEQRSHQQISQPALQHSLMTSMAHHPQHASQVITMMDYQQSQHQGPTVLIQSVPSQAMVPAYLEAFQQHTGQNLQYVTSVDTNTGYGKTQYLAAVPSAVVPGAYQLQAMSDGQLCLDPSSVGISTISGIQLAPAPLAQAQPQVLGTLLQSPLSCGVVATTEPVYETIQMFPDQSGGVLLASQPMLTCMETVVSNTYMSMSSSQFVSSSVPGMLQGSSTYSTTTTQVFQASKVDPPVLDVPTQYVVVNAHPSLSDAAVRKLEVMSISPSQIQEQAPIQSQARIQIPSINLPVPVTVTAPLPPQTLPPVIPTSVVTPMPRVQPQRTYSKPTKVVKDPPIAIMKKPVVLTTCPAVKQTMKSLANQAASKCIKDVAISVARTMPCPAEISKQPNLLDSAPKTPILLPTSNVLKNPISTSVSGCQPPPELIMKAAPVQSVTLPDPVKLNSPVSIVTKVIPVPGPTASAKCPPVTFSYRAHAVEKSKPKQSTTSTAIVSDTPGVIKTNVLNLNVLPARPESHHAIDSSFGLPLVASPSIVVSSEIAVPSTSAAGNTGEHRNDSLSIKKPTAAILPQSQIIEKINPKKIQKVNVSASNILISSKAPGSSTTNVSFAVSKAPVALSATPALSQPTNSTLIFQTSAVSPGSSLNQVGKNASLSLLTASITNSLTSTATSLTATANSTKPVTTTKLLNGSVPGLQPLKEINQTNLNADVKSVPQKTQEKEAACVPPSVLKSASQNVDATKKCDMFCTQGELPLVFSNGDTNPTSLKLLFQKQAHNGCYKVSSSPGKKDGELMAVKLADISIITNGVKDKRGGKDENMKPVSKILKKNHTGPPAPEIVYEIHCQDGFSYSSTSMSDAWQKVFGAVQEARASHKMPPLIHNPFNSVESAHNVMGFGNNSLKYLLEQLPGVGDCSKYRPVYHKSRLPGPGYQYKREDHDLRESHSGCARTDPYLSAKKYDMFSWLDSRHRRPPKLLDNNDADSLTGSRRTASTSLPMAMRFRHLRETSKTSVGVFRSDIHGRGLFCLRDIEAGEMVIEYAGEVIRNTLTDNREKYYQSKGIGCYMFKVDDNFTVDATQKGNAARFINHSCEPNCYSRVVDILGKKHIIIFAFRRIPQGEELTYDYKFPIEDEKIHCHCLARRCRKYLN